MAPKTPTTRRSVRLPITPTSLGKRSRHDPTSDASLLTQDVTPKSKRKRAIKTIDVKDSDEENTLHCSLDDQETPKASISRIKNNYLPPSPAWDNATPRAVRFAITDEPATPTSISKPSHNTPQLSSRTTRDLHAQVRSLIRATSNSTEAMSMSGREEERATIESFLLGFDTKSPEEVQPVLYVSGSPGTGKTALVNSILASMPMTSDTRVVFVNCMAYKNVDELWERLGEDVFAPIAKNGRKTKKSYSKENVIKMFETEKNTKCTIVLDEMDHLSSSISLQPLIHLAVRLPQRIRLLGIANTHTLSSTSSLLPFALESSSEHVKTIHFAPYKSTELLAILQKRLESVPQDELKRLLPQPALILLTKKVAGVTGDVRVLFEVLRGAIDLAVSAAKKGDSSIAANVTVTPAHILSALKAHTPATPSISTGKNVGTSSETVTKVRGLSLQARLVLLVLIIACKRLGQGLSLSGNNPPTLQSPTKRPPLKRTQSTTKVIAFTGKPLGTAAIPQAIEGVQLHSFYCSVLNSSDTFTPLSRSDFTDVLGLLETNGLVSLSSAVGGGARTLKRTTSFSSRNKMGGTSQSVRLQTGIRMGEVGRALGIIIDDAIPKSSQPASVDGDSDVREEAVRSIWTRESSRIKKELKARSIAMDEAEKDFDIGFDDAEEDY